jgi:hypothetical protein
MMLWGNWFLEGSLVKSQEVERGSLNNREPQLWW